MERAIIMIYGQNKVRARTKFTNLLHRISLAGARRHGDFNVGKSYSQILVHIKYQIPSFFISRNPDPFLPGTLLSLINALDWGMTLEENMAAPRLHDQLGLKTFYECN